MRILGKTVRYLNNWIRSRFCHLLMITMTIKHERSKLWKIQIILSSFQPRADSSSFPPGSIVLLAGTDHCCWLLWCEVSEGPTPSSLLPARTDSFFPHFLNVECRPGKWREAQDSTHCSDWLCSALHSFCAEQAGYAIVISIAINL